MSAYITGFSVYTLAMIGIIFIGLVVVKKSLSFVPNKNNNNFLKIEYCLNLEPRKNLYVVKAGKEQFLLASSGETCQFMTKLENKNNFKTVEDTVIPEIKKASDIKISVNNTEKFKKYNTGIF